MIGNHVAQSACVIEVSAAPLHADCLSIGDLNMVDVTPVPDRLEDRIVEPEHHDVLHRFFTQVVIDTIDLILSKDPP